MSLSQFYADWFGIHGGREILLTCAKDMHDRIFISSSEELEDYVNICRASGASAYVSAQPYAARDQPLGVEKLFFEFDCADDPSRAWVDARLLANSIIRYYDAAPLLKFSGRKGYHVDLYLKRTVTFDPNIHSLNLVKEVYKRLQEKILMGLTLRTLDRQVLGDLKRLERVPYSMHEKSGRLCQPIDLEGKHLSPEECNIEAYRENGLSTKLLEHVIHEIQSEKKWRELLRKSQPILRGDPKIRPCIQAALDQPLHGGDGHKMRLAIAVEYLHAGYSVDQVVSLFHAQTDFNEAKTRYFAQHALKVGYKPLKCQTIRKLGYCLGEECSLKKRGRKRAKEGKGS